MQTDTQILEGGFSNPVIQSQAVFHAVMNAMAQPGSIQDIQDYASAPAPIQATTAALVCTLMDVDTPVWLDNSLAKNALCQDWLKFQTAVPIVERATDAVFAIISETSEMPNLASFALGTDEYPDRSTTLIVQVKSLHGSAKMQLKGPGIEREADFAPTPFPEWFHREWAHNHDQFPRGIDLILSAPGALACLPRSTIITSAEG